MTTNIYQAEVVTMKELKNIFIELTAKNCNMHCKHCYIDFPRFKKVDDFIKMETIKSALQDTENENVECIYMTGAEPMTHPDFNAILRYCLTKTNVCICTNGSFINEKKARFLKKVEEESEYKILYKISLDHYDELQNDSIRYRGAYRHAVFAIKHLLKYDFITIVAVTNYFNLPEEEIYKGFLNLFEKNNLNLTRENIRIAPYYNRENPTSETPELSQNTKPDCTNSRTLTTTGIYTCPFLAGDYRGRCGSSFADYNKKSSLETNFCNICLNSEKPVFAVDCSKTE